MKKLSNLKWYFALPVWYLIMTALTFVIWFGLSQAMGGPEDVFTNPVTCLKFACLMATGIACINTNRNFIGIELDENYYNISKTRAEEKRKEKDFNLIDSFGDGM